MSDALDQRRLCEHARRMNADKNQVFYEMVQDGLTRQQLERLIEKNPDSWSVYSGWLEELPCAQKRKV